MLCGREYLEIEAIPGKDRLAKSMKGPLCETFLLRHCLDALVLVISMQR